MFARVEVLLPETKPTLFIPTTAVAYAPYGNSVYVIESKKDEKTGKNELVSRQQFVRTGETRGDFVAVTEGLKEGQEVVSTGVFKMRNGMNVAVDNKLAPESEACTRSRPIPEGAAVSRSLEMKIFTDLFIRRPVLALVVSLVIVIAGVQAISSLNVRQYPKSDIASVTVTTVYVGASAELVRGFITTPLERAIAAADGIDYLQSTSSQGVSTITARLRLNYDSNKALSEISSKVDQVRNDLPPEAEVPVINIESADSQFASAYLSFTSDILQANEITDYLSRIVQPRLTAIEGVQRAEILGGRTFAMRIWLKPDRMAALNVSPAQVRKALANNNYLAALGRTKGSLVQVDLTANTDLHTAEDFKNLVVREENGTLVRLGDIADVVLGAEDYNSEVRFSGQRAVFMGIFVLPNANSIDVIKRVRTEMEAITKDLPTRHAGPHRLRRHGLHQHRDQGRLQNAF